MDADKKLKKNDYIWSYVGYIADISVYAVLTPIMTVLLSPFELGLWYTFMGIYSFINLLDSGFSPIILRNASYALAGAEAFVKTGLPQIKKDAGPNYPLLTSLYKANRRMLTVLSGIFLVLLLSLGTAYISYVTREAFEMRYLYAWGIFALGVTCNVFVMGVPALLKGTGAIAEAQKSIAIGRLIQLVTCLMGVILGYGILGLSVGILTGAVSIGIISSYYCRKLCKPHFIHTGNMTIRQVLDAIWYNSKKLLIVAIGGYCISQANTMICSTFLGLETTAKYGLTVQAFQAVGIIAFVFMQTSLPAISVGKVVKDVDKQKRLLGMAAVVFVIVDIAGSAAVLALGNTLLGLIGAKTLLLPFVYSLLMAITNFLDKHHNLFSQFIVCGNEVPFVKPSVISGILVIIISGLTLKFTNLGLMGLVLSQMLVQAAYNNWKWPYVVCKELHVGLLDLYRLGVSQLKQKIFGK